MTRITFARLVVLMLAVAGLALQGCSSNGDSGMAGPMGPPGEGPTAEEVAKALLADPEAVETLTGPEGPPPTVEDKVETMAMTPAGRIMSSLDGTKPMGSKADVAKMQADIMAALKGMTPTSWYKAANIIPMGSNPKKLDYAVIKGAGLFLDINADGMLDPDTVQHETLDETAHGFDYNNDGDKADVAVALYFNEVNFGIDFNGDGDAMDTNVPLNLVVESPKTGDVNGNNIVDIAGGVTYILESKVSAVYPGTNNVGAELAQTSGRYHFQYDDDGDNANDMMLGADTATETREGIDRRDHLSTFKLTPVLDVDGVSLVKFSIDSAYKTDRNTSTTIPAAPDTNPADDVAARKDGRYKLESYGAWLSDSFFGLHKLTAVTAVVPGTGAVTRSSTWAVNFAGGDHASLAGLGESATWAGAMVGQDTKSTADDPRVQGNAMLKAHIATDTLAATQVGGVAVMDVMFDNITDAKGMPAREESLSWKNLELMERSATKPAGFIKSDGEIEGWLFDDGNEVVGQFDHMDIIGAFGATLAEDNMASE